MYTLNIIIGILLLILIPTITYKAIIRRDWSIAASVIPRVYLLCILAYYLAGKEFGVELIHIGIIAVFFVDIFVNFIYLFSRKYVKSMSELILAKQLKILQDKYVFLVEESPIGKYVLDGDGKMEFVNKTLAEILETTKEDLVGKTFETFALESDLHIFREKFQEKIDNPEIKTDYVASLKTAKGNIVKVRLISKRADNGHITILGSVMPYSRG